MKAHIMLATLGLGLLSAGLCAQSRDAFELRGIVPGTSQAAELEGEDWRPYRSKQGTVGGYSWQSFAVPGYERIRAWVKGGTVVTLDVELPAGVSLAQAVRVFRLGTPRRDQELPASARVGGNPGESVRPVLLDGGAVCVFLSAGEDVVEQLRFYSPGEAAAPRTGAGSRTASGGPASSGGGGSGARPPETTPAAVVGKAQFEKIWITDETTADGRGMRIHAHVKVQGRKGLPTTMAVLFQDAQGRALRGTNQRFCTKSGLVCAWRDLEVTYDRSSWADTSVFIPYSELHLGPGVHEPVAVIVQVIDRKTSAVVRQAEPQRYKITVPEHWGRIDGVLLDGDVVQAAGRGVLIHTDLEVHGLKQEPVRVEAYFFDEAGNHLPAPPGPFGASDGSAVAYRSETSLQGGTHWSDFRVFMPYRWLGERAGTTNKVLCEVRVVDREANQLLARSGRQVLKWSAPARNAYASIEGMTTTYDEQRLLETGLGIHFAVDTQGCQGRPLFASAFFQASDGTPLRDADGNQADAAGNVAIWQQLLPGQDRQRFEGVHLWIPMSQLHRAPGTHQLRFLVMILDQQTGRALARSEFVNFTFQQP